MNKNKKYGIGGSDPEVELSIFQAPQKKPEPIKPSEFRTRINKACAIMKKEEIDALYLNAGTNLLYFTGTQWPCSERLVGAILFANGLLHYVVPEFEIGTFTEYISLEGDLLPWQEHECPIERIVALFEKEVVLAIDDSTPFNLVSKFQSKEKLKVLNAEKLIRDLRMIKSDAEIAQLQYAMDLTMEVQKAVARIIKPGITADEIVNFIDKAHRKLGVSTGSYFCIVLFGKDSSFPHGVKTPKALEEGDIVLVDTGCQYNGYISDITRTYVYGEANKQQTEIWNIEKACQIAAFKACNIGSSCGAIDDEVRRTLSDYGLGPGYNLPGLPHRTGHGIGLEIHENPYILGDNNIKMQPGMTFSIEPMIVVPNHFGVRLEDHIYMTENGPKWFTEPAKSIEDPFGLR